MSRHIGRKASTGVVSHDTHMNLPQKEMRSHWANEMAKLARMLATKSFIEWGLEGPHGTWENQLQPISADILSCTLTHTLPDIQHTHTLVNENVNGFHADWKCCVEETKGTCYCTITYFPRLDMTMAVWGQRECHGPSGPLFKTTILEAKSRCNLVAALPLFVKAG